MRENWCRPYGTRAFVPLTRHFRAGLSHAAATRLEFRWCLFHRLPSSVVLTQSLKPTSLFASDAALKRRSSTKTHQDRLGLEYVRENGCRPLRDSRLFHFTRHFRAGLSYATATRLNPP